jgi:glycerophosphoryl diester phosphodiesterase
MPRVATSASATQFVLILIAAKLRIRPLVRRFVSGVSALQIPERALGMDTTTSSFISVVRSCGVRLEYWVINDEIKMRRLIDRGADGLVTDNVALARRVVDEANAGS